MGFNQWTMVKRFYPLGACWMGRATAWTYLHYGIKGSHFVRLVVTPSSPYTALLRQCRLENGYLTLGVKENAAG
jgi:hypothetical protein